MYKDQSSAYASPVSSVDTSPRPFGEIPALWVKATQMTEDFFTQEAGRASGSNTLISILILAVVSAIFSALSALISIGIQQMMGVSAYGRDTFVAGMGGVVLCALCGGPLITVLGFYLGNGLIYLGARVFGGSGDYGSQTYLQSLFNVPIGIVTSVVLLVNVIPVAGPCIGGIVALALAIYAVILNVRAIKVVHNLTTGKAVAAIFVPALIIGAIMACLATVVIMILALMGPEIGEIFEEIITSLQ